MSNRSNYGAKVIPFRRPARNKEVFFACVCGTCLFLPAWGITYAGWRIIEAINR